MATDWTLPTTIRQYVEPGAEEHHIPWKDDKNFASCRNADGSITKTVVPLLHISRSPKYDIRQKTYFLEFSGYNFVNLPEIITGVAVKIQAVRRGRVTDETVSLCLDQNLIGDNKADRNLNPVKIYGSENDKWGVDLSKSDLNNPSFGVCVRFQSHPDFPHRDEAGIDTVQIQIY